MTTNVSTIVFAYHNMGLIGLEALQKHGFDVVAVFTHQDDPNENRWFGSVREWCTTHGIPCYAPTQVNQRKWVERIQTLAPQFIFSFYYRQLLCQKILDAASHGAFNLHGSLLPKYRGRAPVNWAILKGEAETGVTLHHMVERADAGHIVGQHTVPIARDDTTLTLYGKLEPAAERLLNDLLPSIMAGSAPSQPQDESQATTFGRRRPADGHIHWQQPCENIYNLIRAVTHPYPGAFTHVKGKQLLIWWGTCTDAPSQRPAGELLIDGNGAYVNTASGLLHLAQVEFEGTGATGNEVAEMLRPHHGTMLD